MERTSTVKAIYHVYGSARATLITAGDGVWVKTVKSGGLYEMATVLGLRLKGQGKDSAEVDVMWLWSPDDLQNDLKTELIASGARDDDRFIVLVGRGRRGTVSLESLAYDRFMPYFRCEEDGIELASVGTKTQRVFGFIRHTKAAGELLEQYVAESDDGPRKKAKSVLEYCQATVPDFVAHSPPEVLTRAPSGCPCAGLCPLWIFGPLLARL